MVVWIYGGGFVNGGSSPPTYSGAELARQGVLVVSFNYRLGRFGTFAHPQLTTANEDGGLLGNYGVMDQIAALEWIQRNIAAFGGDPGNVTVMGESAGGMSVNMLLTSPRAQHLMQRAVIMSGGDGRELVSGTLDSAERIGVEFGGSQGIAADDPVALATSEGSVPGGAASLGANSCIQSLPYVPASRIPGQVAAGCGARQRRSPTGGAANGMPFQLSTAPSTVPRSTPCSIPTTVAATAGGVGTANQASTAAAASTAIRRVVVTRSVFQKAS